MKINKITTTLSAMLLTGAFASGAMAAESAAGVKEHFQLTIDTTKGAQDAAQEGNKEGCLAKIKQAKQHYKEVTGDAAGKGLQDAMKRVKEAQTECEAGNTGTAAEILGEAVISMQKLQPK